MIKKILSIFMCVTLLATPIIVANETNEVSTYSFIFDDIMLFRIHKPLQLKTSSLFAWRLYSR